MSDKVIAARLQVDTGNSNQNIKEVNKNLGDTTKALNTTSTAAKGTSKDISGTGGSFGNLKEKLTGLPGPLGSAGDGVGKLSTAFKALLANPVALAILAIVAALTFLYKAFTNSFEGAQKFEQIFAGIKAAVQVVIDRIFDLGGAVIKFFSGDFKGAISDAKKAVTGVGDEITKTYKAVAELTKQAQALKKEQLQNDLEAAERAKKLAILREQAEDPDVSRAKRKSALLELQKDAEQNAKDDIDLAKRTSENKIALLSFGKDAAKKNADEINQIKIGQINVETENANELRRIGKQITAADRADLAEQKAARDKAVADDKERRAKLVAYNQQLSKVQQDNELASIKDTYQKSLKELDFKLANEKRANGDSFKDGKITKAQQNELNIQSDQRAAKEWDELETKHRKEVADKEAAFQKELAAIQKDIRLKSITDTRELERVQLKIGYEEKLQDAIERYKDDQAKLNEVRIALGEQYRIEQAKADEKNRIEDEQKKAQIAKDALDATLKDPTSSIETKRAAVQAEIDLNQELFDKKLIAEKDYNKAKQDLSAANIELDKAEGEAKKATVDAIGTTLGNLSQLAGKQTVVGKALAIAQTAIDTYQSAIAAYKSLAGIPVVGPALGAIAAAAAVATGIAAVKKIVAVQVPGQSSGGAAPSGLSVAAPAPIAPTQSTTTLDQTSLNQIGNATSKTYVLDSDVQNNRERDTRLNRAARLGG